MKSFTLASAKSADRKTLKPMHTLLQLACDADFYSTEVKAGLIPSRALFKDVKELAYLCEVDTVLRNAIEATASGGPTPKDS